GSLRGPGVFWKSRSSSRIVIYTLPLNTGFERPNELRGTTLTEPASAEPWAAGVGEYETSTREALLMPRKSSATARPVAPDPVLATLNPSIVIGTLSVGTPAMETSRGLLALKLTVRPGMNFRNSPTLLSEMLPNSSVDTTVLMLGAKRCSLMASA